MNMCGTSSSNGHLFGSIPDIVRPKCDDTCYSQTSIKSARHREIFFCAGEGMLHFGQ